LDLRHDSVEGDAAEIDLTGNQIVDCWSTAAIGAMRAVLAPMIE
jgi:hypothetical protein